MLTLLHTHKLCNKLKDLKKYGLEKDGVMIALINAIKELKQQNDNLLARIVALEA